MFKISQRNIQFKKCYYNFKQEYKTICIKKLSEIKYMKILQYRVLKLLKN